MIVHVIRKGLAHENHHVKDIQEVQSHMRRKKDRLWKKKYIQIHFQNLEIKNILEVQVHIVEKNILEVQVLMVNIKEHLWKKKYKL